MQSNQHMKDFVIGLLNTKLSKFYYYHNVGHTLYVVQKVIEIGQHEKCSAKEIDLLSTAALWHDAGFINVYTGHEEEGCKMVQQYLPGYGYNSSDIAVICGMIMATKLPHRPNNKLEEIIADADLEYLGTESAAEKANDLYKELHHLNPQLTRAAWNNVQIDFCKQHHYFTAFCKKNKTPQKLIYIQTLINADK